MSRGSIHLKADNFHAALMAMEDALEEKQENISSNGKRQASSRQWMASKVVEGIMVENGIIDLIVHCLA